jgi:hypothetical protein
MVNMKFKSRHSSFVAGGMYRIWVPANQMFSLVGHDPAFKEHYEYTHDARYDVLYLGTEDLSSCGPLTTPTFGVVYKFLKEGKFFYIRTTDQITASEIVL